MHGWSSEVILLDKIELPSIPMLSSLCGHGGHGSIGDSVLIQSREIASHNQGAGIASIIRFWLGIWSHCNGDAVGATISDHCTIPCPSVGCGGPSPGHTKQSEGWGAGSEWGWGLERHSVGWYGTLTYSSRVVTYGGLMEWNGRPLANLTLSSAI